MCDTDQMGIRGGNSTWRLDTTGYQRVFNARQRFWGSLLTLCLYRGSAAGCCVGVIASKRNFKRAVDRNRVKRLLREAFRLQRLTLVQDVDLVLIARQALLGKGLSEVQAELDALCRQARIVTKQA